MVIVGRGMYAITIDAVLKLYFSARWDMQGWLGEVMFTLEGGLFTSRVELAWFCTVGQS